MAAVRIKLFCRVDFEETILVAEAAKARRKRQREGEESSASKPSPEETFHPVFCKVCDTKLGLYDSDEVFHFWGVVASEP